MHTGFWCGRPEGKRTLRRPRRRWENNIKTVLQELGWGCGLDYSGLGQGEMAGDCECDIEISGSIKMLVNS